MKLLSATVIRDATSADYISIKTDLIDGCWPYTAPLHLNFRVAKGQTEAYMEINFPGLPLLVIDTTRG